MSPAPLGSCNACGYFGRPAGQACPVCGAANGARVALPVPSAGDPPALEGWVIQTAMRAEPRDFSWLRLLGWMALVGVALMAGVVVLIVCLILGLLFRSTPGMQWLWGLLFASRGRRDHTHQVLELFVAQDNGAESMAVVKAQRLRGAVQAGHRVRLWGTLRGGVLRVRRGVNLTTRSEFGPAGWLG